MCPPEPPSSRTPGKNPPDRLAARQARPELEAEAELRRWGSLDLFHPILQRWFREEVGTPTQAQALAWPLIARGGNVLVSAPTGSGKTLTAFLWALQQLLTGAWPAGEVRVLYVSPHKALNYDIERNLQAPLAVLEARFRAARVAIPEIRVLTRTGDTPQEDRRRMGRHPPEILITTPETLNILLTSLGGRKLLGGVVSVILDEVHAVAASKRGAHLITAVERLARLAGGHEDAGEALQRIGLSATVRPLERIAEWLGGRRHERRRPVEVVRVTGTKTYELKVQFPAALEQDRRTGDGFWQAVVADLKKIVRANHSTLIFANSRRMTERLTRMINDAEADGAGPAGDGGRDLAYSHHGSLSREIRRVVEERLKAGQLEAIVATNSLELGIDVGDLDEVLLVQTPPSIASAIQRIGRSGHGVGQVSRGRLFPSHGRDFLDAAVVARAVLESDVEALRPVAVPLDVLAQILVSMVAAESWDLDELFDFLRTSDPFKALTLRQLELVVEMLAGRFADARIRELQPRLSFDRVARRVHPRPGIARLVYLSGGTIPDRGYFHLRRSDTKAKVGELDEEFVWERSVGDSFNLGAQSWRIEGITHNDVLVSPTRGAASLAPFWRAERRNRGFYLSEKIAVFLEQADDRLADTAFAEELQDAHGGYAMDPVAARELLEYLGSQKQATGVALPHRHHLVVEVYADPSDPERRRQMVLHTFWGGEINQPLAIALAAAWEDRSPYPVEVLHDDDCVHLALPERVEPGEILDLVNEANLEGFLRRRLESTGFFGARFRENAAVALLLPRQGFKSRTPLWLSRMRSKKLLAAVKRYPDFPILTETWRTCLQDSFDLEGLKTLLGELSRGEISTSVVHTTQPSPFAAGVLWQQTNKWMYEDDTPEGDGASNLRPDLLQELVFSSELRPRLAADLVARFEAKVQRTAPGYAPRLRTGKGGESGAGELIDWLQERVAMPLEEWRDLLAAIARDREGTATPEELQTWQARLAARALSLRLPGAATRIAVAVESLPRLLFALDLESPAQLEPRKLTLGSALGEGGSKSPGESAEAPTDALQALVRLPARGDEDGGAREGIATELLAEWARFYGPFRRQHLEAVWGAPAECGLPLELALETLLEERRWIVDVLREGTPDQEPELCDAENLEILLRLVRSEARPSFEALPLQRLPLFLAAHQGLTSPGGTVEHLQEALETLFAFPAPARAWEGEILPARLAPYYPAWLDALMQESALLWVGCGPRKVTFAFPEDLELFQGVSAAPAATPADPRLDPLKPKGRLSFEELTAAAVGGAGTGANSHSEPLEEGLWQAAWRGEVTNDTFASLRRLVERRFKTGSAVEGIAAASRGRPATHRAASGRRSRRTGLRRWNQPSLHPGRWRWLEPAEAELDALEQEELNKDRARLLLERYGVVFRQLLARELPALAWGKIFRSLRLMELSGEVLAGQFFTGVPGLQFAGHAAFRRLAQELPETAVWWHGAQDPASLCGVDLEGLKSQLPARRASTHLAWLGSRLALISRGHGRRLDIRVAADDPRLAELLTPLKGLLDRPTRPRKVLEVETVNGEPVLESPYAAVLAAHFSATREARTLRLRKRYATGIAGSLGDPS